MSAEGYVDLYNNTVAERRAKYLEDTRIASEQAIKTQEENAKKDKDTAEANKIAFEREKEQRLANLLYGFNEEQQSYLLEYLKLIGITPNNIESKYDPDSAKKAVYNHEKHFKLIEMFSKEGKTIGTKTFTPITCLVGNGCLIIPDNNGKLYYQEGIFGKFEMTEKSLVVDSNGYPIKIGRASTIRELNLPIIEYETVIIKDPKEPEQSKTIPNKSLFPKQNVSEIDDLSKNPEKKLRDNKRHWKAAF